MVPMMIQIDQNKIKACAKINVMEKVFNRYALSLAYLQCFDFYEDIKSTFFVLAEHETEPK